MQNRSRWARLLARKIVLHPDRTSLRWAMLGSVWLHMALLLALAFTPRLPSLEQDTRYFELVETKQSTGQVVSGHETTSSSREHPEEDSPSSLSDTIHSVERIIPPHREDPDTVRVARTEEAGESPKDRLDAISAHDQLSDTPSRAPVLSDVPGLPTEPTEGPSERSASPTLQRRPGDLEAAMGNSMLPGDDAVVMGAGGGVVSPSSVTADAEGSPTEGDGESPGGMQGPLGEDAPARGSAQAERPDRGGGASQGGGARLVVTAPDGPDPTRQSMRPTPSWWQPTTTRVAPSTQIAQQVTPQGASSDGRHGPAPAQATARAPVDRATTHTQTGGTEVNTRAPSVPEAAVASGVRRRIAAPGTADPVDELRRDLGFGPLDRSKLAPRPAWAGDLYQDGTSSSSPQVALDVPIAWKTALSTRGTALGAYVQHLEELIAERWNSQDLDAHSRAVGMQGNVTVRYRITPDGRTGDISIVRSSGNPLLDNIAITAIPARVPRFPKDLDRQPLQHELTLHYRNPLIGP